MSNGASCFIIKAGDTGRPYRSTLLDGAAQPIDLTNRTVHFRMKDRFDLIVVDQAAIIEAPPADGVVRYDFAPADVERVGNYTAWWVIDAATSPVHVPSIGGNGIRIESAELD